MFTEKEVISAALTLPPLSRTIVIDRLLASLTESDREEIDALWAREAEDRIDAYEQGKITSVPGEQVFQNILNEANDEI